VERRKPAGSGKKATWKKGKKKGRVDLRTENSSPVLRTSGETQSKRHFGRKAKFRNKFPAEGI